MTKRRDDESAATGALGAFAVGGAGLAGASVLGGLLGEQGSSASRDLGPAPIGSDPWLFAEVTAAIAREKGVDSGAVTVVVREAIVTLRGEIDARDAARVEAAARTVQGIKKLNVELTQR